MLAEVDDAGVDGAVQVAHALTTHATDVELDYFSAVDDVTDTWGDATGSAHMGHAEFSAGTSTATPRSTFGTWPPTSVPSPQAVRELAVAFLESFIESLPKAKQTPPLPTRFRNSLT